MHAFAHYNRQKLCRYGQMLFNINDAYIGRSLDLYGEFSEREVDVFRQIVRPGHTVIEVGANIGCHTLFFARQVGPNGRVLAFDPQRIVFQTLCANMALNHVTNAWCFPHAVGATCGEVAVPVPDYLSPGNFGALALHECSSGETVPIVTLDSLALAACTFIKIDVEGMEQQVLRGAVQTLAKLKPVLYVENDRPEYAANLIRLVDELEYVMYWHLPPLFNPENYARNENNVFGNTVSMNMLCIHRDKPAHVEGLHAIKVQETIGRFS